MSYVYSAAAKVAANTSFRELLDSESGNAKMLLVNSGGTTLATITFDDPCGTVNGTTGQLTLTVHQNEANAPETGTIDEARIVDGADNVHLTIPVKQGTAPDPGWVVVSSTSVIAGGAINAQSVTIG